MIRNNKVYVVISGEYGEGYTIDSIKANKKAASLSAQALAKRLNLVYDEQDDDWHDTYNVTYVKVIPTDVT